MKIFVIILVLIPLIPSQTEAQSKPTDNGAWLFALTDFSEMKFPAGMLRSSDPVILDVALSVDGKGRVRHAIVNPASTAFSDAATKTAQKWRFSTGIEGELRAHICFGRQDDGQGIGLPCDVQEEPTPHLRILLFSSKDLRIESPLKPDLSAAARARILRNPPRGLWAHAKVLIGEDGSVLEAHVSGDIVDQDFARSMKESLRFRPIHLNGHAVEAVAYIFMPAN